MRCHPPKLLSAVTKDTTPIVEDFEEVQKSAPPPAQVDDEELLEIALDLVSAPLEKGPLGGGGVRIPPPRLKVSTHQDTKTIELALEEQLPENALEETAVTEEGGGARLPPPKLQPVSERTAAVLEAELEELQSKELEPKWNGGGGVRVPPPKLLPSGEYKGAAFDDNQYSAPPGSLEEEILAMTTTTTSPSTAWRLI